MQNSDKYQHITLAKEKLANGKLDGVSPNLVNRLARIDQVNYVIVEADGAARKPLKAPNATEPVIPAASSLVIPLVGIDAVGSRLTEENIFRAEIASKLLGVPLGKVVSAESVAVLITHPQGITKGSPEKVRVVPFINKVDLDPGLKKARDLARRILANEHPQIKRVVLGQVQLSEPVVEVISREGHRLTP